MPHNKHFQISKVNKLPNSEAEITGEITLPFLVELRSEALKHLNEETKIDGFRPGRIPEDVLAKQVGEMSILAEAAELALGREYPRIVEEAKLSPIGRPDISITKLAPGIPLEFKIKVALEPEFDLPDYKKIAGKVSKEEEGKVDKESLVTDKEVQEVMEEIKKRNMPLEANLKERETLEGKIKENLREEKKYRAQEKRRLKIIEELVKSTKVEVPGALVDAELHKMLGQFKDDVSRALGQALRQNSGQAGDPWQQYLEKVGKTEDDLRSEWRERAVERVKAEFIVIKIAEEEEIEPTKEEVEVEAGHFLEHYPEADPARVRIYIFTQLRNRKVMEFLEKQN